MAVADSLEHLEILSYELLLPHGELAVDHDRALYSVRYFHTIKHMLLLLGTVFIIDMTWVNCEELSCFSNILLRKD